MIDFSALDAQCVIASPDRALEAFYGKGNTVRALTGTGARPQEVYTDTPILKCLQLLWPEGIECDPCSGPDSIIPARVRYCVPGRQRTVTRRRKGKDGKYRDVEVVDTYYEAQPGDTDGLTLPWFARSYVNFPFDAMGTWLERASTQPREQAVLCPVRTHRNSYRDFTEICDQVIWLDYSIKFRGFKDAFPAPLSILYRGDRDAEAAFASIGRRAKIR